MDSSEESSTVNSVCEGDWKRSTNSEYGEPAVVLVLVLVAKEEEDCTESVMSREDYTVSTDDTYQWHS